MKSEKENKVDGNQYVNLTKVDSKRVKILVLFSLQINNFQNNNKENGVFDPQMAVL